MSLDDKFVKEVCKPGQGEATCSYLLLDSREGWQCGKLTSFKRVIDRRRASGEMTAKGDNCPGVSNSLAPPDGPSS